MGVIRKSAEKAENPYFVDELLCRSPTPFNIGLRAAGEGAEVAYCDAANTSLELANCSGRAGAAWTVACPLVVATHVQPDHTVNHRASATTAASPTIPAMYVVREDWLKVTSSWRSGSRSRSPAAVRKKPQRASQHAP